MNYLAIFHFAPEGGGPFVAARWQHGKTPGIKVHSAWVTTVPWADMDEGMGSGRSFIAFEAESAQDVSNFVNYLQPISRKIEVWPVNDYLPFMEAYDSGDPAQFPAVVNAPTDEARQAQLDQMTRYRDAASPLEAIEAWRSTPQAQPNIQAARRRTSGGVW